MQTTTVVLLVAGVGTSVAVLLLLTGRRAPIAQDDVPGVDDDVQTFTTGSSTPPPPLPVKPSLVERGAELVGELAAQADPLAMAAGAAGFAADFANTTLKTKTEKIFKDQGLDKDLRQFDKRQAGYDSANKKVDDFLVGRTDAAYKNAPKIIQGLTHGLAQGTSEIVEAPIKIAQTLDSAVSGQIGKFKKESTVEKAITIAMGPMYQVDSVVNNVIFDGIGGGIANIFAKTPKQKEQAQHVLDLINPTKEVDRVVHWISGKIERDRAARAAKKAKIKADADKKVADAKQERVNQSRLTARADALAARVAKEKADKAAADKVRAAKVQAEKARVAKEKAARDAKELADKARAAKEKAERDRAEKDRKENAEKAAKAAQEKAAHDSKKRR